MVISLNSPALLCLRTSACNSTAPQSSCRYPASLRLHCAPIVLQIPRIPSPPLRLNRPADTPHPCASTAPQSSCRYPASLRLHCASIVLQILRVPAPLREITSA